MLTTIDSDLGVLPPPPEEPAPMPPPPPAPPSVCDSTVCFDCENELSWQPWVSVTYGISLCLVCAGHHRSLGVHLSFVRSLELDFLTARETRALVLGGNVAFSLFLAGAECNMPRHAWLALPLRDRYSTAAAELFRGKLAASLDAEEAVQTQDGSLLGSQPVSAALTAPIANAVQQAAQHSVQWTPDSEAPRCQLCKSTFGRVFNRRHHCRKCGRCVCDECSPPGSWRPIAGNEAPERHCKLCVTPTRTIAALSLPFET